MPTSRRRQIESLIVTLKREKPHWGARKIRELLVRLLDQDVRSFMQCDLGYIDLEQKTLQPLDSPERTQYERACLSPGQ